MSHPLEAYFSENKSGAITDEQAKDSIAGLVNDPALLQDVCAMFAVEINSADRCFAVGEVYDVEDERYGCLTVLSEDVVNVIGAESLQETHEEINYTLLCAYLEYRRFCQEVQKTYDAWDDYLEFVMQKSFVTLFKNGVRARLIHTDAIGKAAMPVVAFIVYQNYAEL
ncbi:conserved hypothetical protein [Methanocella paludicola SANAE]|uniref:Uncharacterized protein n=1 Tax=Methanocella paludicola (strain DSM 17711 / JCM 13418 / NBRC 101707 / SANAE) TaxID=304371 RepID=D1YY40_METPS|nr:hypothetical protein [Methanocella paludicola]BAI61362.1 conserved hypothetical protein [Methanocella paludicola SANAE]